MAPHLPLSYLLPTLRAVHHQQQHRNVMKMKKTRKEEDYKERAEKERCRQRM